MVIVAADMSYTVITSSPVTPPVRYHCMATDLRTYIISDVDRMSAVVLRPPNEVMLHHSTCLTTHLVSAEVLWSAASPTALSSPAHPPPTHTTQPLRNGIKSFLIASCYYKKYMFDE